MDIRAILFDFGGVILTSPFEAFLVLEEQLEIPSGTIRGINATNPDTNAWALLERSEVSIPEFSDLFAEEAASAGFEISGHDVLDCLRGEIRPEMVAAIETLRGQFKIALLTNNFVSGNPEWSSGGSFGELLKLFDVVVESSVVGVRKPERRFYDLAVEQLGIQPEEAVFLDDLGVNLKPAREMGMATIKVTDPVAALRELSELTGLQLI